MTEKKSAEGRLIERGAEDVLIAANGSQDLNFDVMAQTCARESRSAESKLVASAWTKAGIRCYERAADQSRDEVTRQGRLLGAYSLRGAHILRMDNADTDSPRYLQEIHNWILAGTKFFSSVEEYRVRIEDMSHDEYFRAHLLCERLQFGFILRAKFSVYDDLEPWLAASASSTLPAFKNPQ